MQNSLIIFFLTLITICDAWSQDAPQISVELLTKTTNSWDGNALPLYPDGTPEITIQRVTIPANTTLPWHKHPVINAGIILSGKLTVVTREGKQINLTEGDSTVETVETWHQGINRHPEPVEIIVFYAGILKEPLTIQEQ